MSDITRSETIDVIELIMRKYEEDECICCDIMLGDEEYEALRFARDSLKTDEAYQTMYEGGEIFTKADMVAMLTDLKKQIDGQCKIPNNCASAYDWNNGVYACYKVIQQKIDALKKVVEDGKA